MLIAGGRQVQPREFSWTVTNPPNQPFCVTISKIALKQVKYDQVFMALGRALPNHCFVGKNMTVLYRMLYNIWLVTDCHDRDMQIQH